MRILLVDDSTTMRNVQKAVLAELGHTDITEAVDGLDALAKAKDCRPQLILVDSTMPRMDGVTFAKAWRKHDSKTPIILVTTEADKARLMEAVKAGVSGYIVKPFTPEALGQRIQETLAKVGLSAAA